MCPHDVFIPEQLSYSNAKWPHLSVHYCQLSFSQGAESQLRAPRQFWYLGIVRNPLSLKTSRRNTQGLSQPPAHLLKSEFTSYFRVAHSESNTWRCCWAPSSGQQELNLQSQHAWGYLKAVSSSWWLCPIAAASSTEALVKTPSFCRASLVSFTPAVQLQLLQFWLFCITQLY